MEVLVGSAKTPKMGVGESGDTLEVVERRKGGLSVVLADGQGSGPAAKRISSIVVGRVVTLIGEGVRDGAAARAAHDFLYALRDGKVSCELVIVSADARTKSIVVSRNTAVPVLVRLPGGKTRVLSTEVEPLGVHETMRPSIEQFEFENGTMVLAMTDGITQAGSRTGRSVSIEDLVAMLQAADPEDPQALADKVLSMGMTADAGHPLDDMCAVAMSVIKVRRDIKIRKLRVDFPI